MADDSEDLAPQGLQGVRWLERLRPLLARLRTSRQWHLCEAG
jgi:hypothetical protein